MTKALLGLALAVGAEHALCQSFHYAEPGLASCPVAPAPTTAAPKSVPRGVPVFGSLNVACGLDQGSYTVTLTSTDPRAKFSRPTFLVNFGRIAGDATFSVTFAAAGVQSVSTTITSNMGSPAARGYFVSRDNQFNVGSP